MQPTSVQRCKQTAQEVLHKQLPAVLPQLPLPSRSRTVAVSAKSFGKGMIVEVEELKAVWMADVGGQAVSRCLMRHLLKAWPAQ